MASPKISKISAMDFRFKPGTYLDLSDYLGESFIILRGTKPKAVLIPYSDFHHYQLLKQQRRRLLSQAKQQKSPL